MEQPQIYHVKRNQAEPAGYGEYGSKRRFVTQYEVSDPDQDDRRRENHQRISSAVAAQSLTGGQCAHHQSDPDEEGICPEATEESKAQDHEQGKGDPNQKAMDRA